MTRKHLKADYICLEIWEQNNQFDWRKEIQILKAGRLGTTLSARQ